MPGPAAPPPPSTTSWSTAIWLLRDRGERYDFTARVNTGYTANMVPNTGGSQDRTTRSVSRAQ